MRLPTVIALALALGLAAAPASAWQDLREEYVRGQVACVAATDKPAAERAACAWSLVGTGRPAVHPLAEVARKHPDLTFTALQLLDTLRVNSEVVRLFSEFLDAPPTGLKEVAGAKEFLAERLEQMLDRKFASPDARRAWVKAKADLLVWDPARLRFEVDAAAYRGGWLPTKPKAGPALAASLAFERLIKALVLGHEPAVRELLGPAVSPIRAGGKVDTRPELDLDAFAGPIHQHRALVVRDEGQGRWLMRTGSAYFFFEGDPARCVKAGLKPME